MITASGSQIRLFLLTPFKCEFLKVCGCVCVFLAVFLKKHLYLAILSLTKVSLFCLCFPVGSYSFWAHNNMLVTSMRICCLKKNLQVVQFGLCNLTSSLMGSFFFLQFHHQLILTLSGNMIFPITHKRLQLDLKLKTATGYQVEWLTE